MKNIKINDASDDHVEVSTYGPNTHWVVLKAFEAGEGATTMEFSAQQSKQLRKALKKAEKEISS